MATGMESKALRHTQGGKGGLCRPKRGSKPDGKTTTSFGQVVSNMLIYSILWVMFKTGTKIYIAVSLFQEKIQ